MSEIFDKRRDLLKALALLEDESVSTITDRKLDLVRANLRSALEVVQPDWIDAPAVIAWSRWDDVRREKVWSKDDGRYKSTDGEIANRQDLRDVTPLYPKEQDA